MTHKVGSRNGGVEIAQRIRKMTCIYIVNSENTAAGNSLSITLPERAETT
jgi:hypothetical protein